jgi:hypothetical protein
MNFMKYFVTALSVIIISVFAIVANSFMEDSSVENISIAKTQATQERNQAVQEQLVPKRDSFTAGKAFGKEKGGLDDREAMIGRGKNYLLTQVDNRLKQLGPFKARIENATALSDPERKSLVSELDAEIGAFEGFKPEINKSATEQDIKNVADKIKAEWIKSRDSVRRAEGLILAAKETRLIAEAETASQRIQKRIALLKAFGKNAKAHEELLSSYGQKIASAKRDVEAAKEKFEAIASAPTEAEKEKLTRGRELLLMSARNSIKDAYKLLVEGVRQEFSQRYSK